VSAPHSWPETRRAPRELRSESRSAQYKSAFVNTEASQASLTQGREWTFFDKSEGRLGKKELSRSPRTDESGKRPVRHERVRVRAGEIPEARPRMRAAGWEGGPT